MAFSETRASAPPIAPLWEYETCDEHIIRAADAYNDLGTRPDRGESHEASRLIGHLLKEARKIIPHNDPHADYRAERAFDNRAGNCMAYHEVMAAMATFLGIRDMVGQWDSSAGHASNGLAGGDSGHITDGYYNKPWKEKKGVAGTCLPASVRLDAWDYALEKAEAVFLGRPKYEEEWVATACQPDKVGSVDLEGFEEFTLVMPAVEMATMLASLGDYARLVGSSHPYHQARLPLLEPYIPNIYHSDLPYGESPVE